MKAIQDFKPTSVDTVNLTKNKSGHMNLLGYLCGTLLVYTRMTTKFAEASPAMNILSFVRLFNGQIIDSKLCILFSNLSINCQGSVYYMEKRKTLFFK